jgi:6-phosphogluconolactonase
MQLHIYNDTETTVHAIADFFIAVARKAIKEKDQFNVALSGGSTPRRLYGLLSSEYESAIEWKKVFFFFGDERNVPANDADNNGRMARESLFDPLRIAPEQIFYIQTALGPAMAAENYASAIKTHFGNNAPVFDLVLLGLGDNSHTASLFPHTSILEENSLLVADVYVEELQAYRISMTAPLINQAKKVAFLVNGLPKAAAVRNIIDGERNYQEYPAQLISPAGGEMHWFMDKAAALQLDAGRFSGLE